MSATAASASQINLSWSASAGATTYNVYRSTTSGGPYTLAGSSATTSFSDTSLACATTFYYVVRAVSGTCESANSAQASATTGACVAPPPVPPFLTVNNEQCYGSNTVHIGASAGATFYELYRSPSPTFTTQSLHSSGPNLFRFVNVGTTTYLRVRACNADGCSGYRNGNQTAEYFNGCL